MRMREKKKKG